MFESKYALNLVDLYQLQNSNGLSIGSILSAITNNLKSSKVYYLFIML